MIRSCLLLAVAQIFLATSKTLDNRLLANPTVSCGPEALRISAESEDLFEGQVYIKTARRSSPDCYSAFTLDMNSTNPELSLPLGRIASCGLEMRRQDSRSLQLSLVVVFSFHPSFVTAGDRAFAVHCLFSQQDRPVNAKFNFVDDLKPLSLEGTLVEVPTVRLELVPGRMPSETSPSQHIQIGQPLMLVWKMDNESMVYGIRVLDCAAESRDGKGMQILADGCSQDTHLITDVRYSDERQRAFSDAVAFKFPDLDEVFFRCHVQLCIRRFEHLLVAGKSEEDLCEEKPSCSPQRIRRSRESDEGVIVVRGRMTVREEEHDTAPTQLAQVSAPMSLCLSRSWFAVGSAVSVTVYTATLATVILLVYSKIRSKCQ